MAAATPAAGASKASDVELEFWRSIKDSNKPEELNAFLSNYPNGQFRSLALSLIASLESGPKPDATRNLSAGIDPATFKEEANQTTEDQIGLEFFSNGLTLKPFQEQKKAEVKAEVKVVEKVVEKPKEPEKPKEKEKKAMDVLLEGTTTVLGRLMADEDCTLTQIRFMIGELLK